MSISEAFLKALTPLTMTVAYRNWLLAEAKREVDGGCARLLSVPDEITVLLGEAMTEWSPARQLERMREAITVFCRPRGTAAPPSGQEELPLGLFWRQSDRLVKLRQKDRDGAFKVEKRRLRRQVEKRLTALFGPPLWTNGGEVRHVTHLAGLTVFTDIDFSPRAPRKLAYEQVVVSGTVDACVRHMDDRVLRTHMSLFNLLGSASTSWSFIKDDDVPRVVDTLEKMCSGWIDAIPGMVEAAQAT